MPNHPDTGDWPDHAQTAAAITSLLDSQVQCVLATLAAEGPVQHLMAYAFEPSLQCVYLASLRDTEKVANMQRRRRVSLFWDNRTGNSRDHVEGLALMATGEARALAGTEHVRAGGALLARNQSLRGLLRVPDVVTFAVDIGHYRLVRGYTSQHVYQPGG